MEKIRLNVYDEIKKNNKKTVFIILLFPLVFAITILIPIIPVYLYFSARTISECLRLGCWREIISLTTTITLITTIVCLFWTAVSWFMGDQIILNSADAHEISRSTHPEVFTLVENLTIATGLPLPRIYIIDDESLNAFATGRDPEHSSIALTTGIINKLNRSELEGVIGHELAHIANYDIRLTMLVATSIGIISLIAQFLFRIDTDKQGRLDKHATGFCVVIACLLGLYSGIFAPLIMYALSRRREFQADATSAYMTRNPLGLASALKKISKDSKVAALEGKNVIAAACIIFPGESSLSKESLFSTHPPIKDRIAKLRAM